MRNEKFSFTVEENETEYILWMWRGDYLNLGAGAEVGIYSRPTWLSQDSEALDQYFTDYELAMPMQLYLYNYESSSNIENILAWNPDEDQWWITGFNPDYLRDEVDVNKQVMISSVDFTQFDELDENGKVVNKMYDEFVNDITENNHELLDFMILDDDNRTIWILWGERTLIK